MKWIRVTFKGELGGGVEQFQHKLDLGLPGDDPELDEAGCLALAEQMAGLFDSYWTPSSGWFSNQVRYTEVGAVAMTQNDATEADGSGGDLAQDFETQWFAWPTGDRPVGTGNGNSLPYEVSCAVTLQSDHRGPSGRGRFYLPPYYLDAMAAGGLFGAGVTNVIGGAWGDLFDSVIADTPHVPVVVSPRKKILNAITQINMGLVPDSQRRRRRSQEEARVVLWPV